MDALLRKTASFLAAVLVFTLYSGSLRAADMSDIALEERYRAGRFFLTRSQGEGSNDAILFLEGVAREDAVFRDTLTLLGRGYYNQHRYGDTQKILMRALAANREDEIAWLAFGLTQLRLREEEKGLESIKGGLTLLNKAMKENYRGLADFDSRGLVRKAFRQAVLVVAKEGLAAKDKVVERVEYLLRQIDEEETARVSWIVHTNVRDGYAIALPPSWIRLKENRLVLSDALNLLKESEPEIYRMLESEKESRNASAVLFSAFDWPATPEAMSSIGITKHEISAPLTLDEVGKAFLAVYGRLKFIDGLIKSERVNQEFGDAFYLQYRMKVKTPIGAGGTFSVHQHVTVGNKEIYQLVFACTEDRAEYYAPIFEKMAKTFEWRK